MDIENHLESHKLQMVLCYIARLIKVGMADVFGQFLLPHKYIMLSYILSNKQKGAAAQPQKWVKSNLD